MVQVKHFPQLDYLRGFAILGVFIFHSLGISFGYDHLPWNGLWRSFDVSRSFLPFYPLTFGRLGVSLFFVISGFCIHWSFSLSLDKRFLHFFIRRFFRIYPTYVVFLLAAIGLTALQLSYSKSAYSLDSRDLLSHLFLYHNFTKEYFFGINSSLWSIAVEAQLYVLYPLLYWLSKCLGSWGRAALLAIVTEVSIRSLMAYFSVVGSIEKVQFLSQMPLTYWGSWALGTKIANDLIVSSGSGIDSRVGISKGLMTLLILALVISDWFQPACQFQFLMFAVIGSMWLKWALQVTENGSALSGNGRWSNRLKVIGVVSYSLYLIHQPIMQWLWMIPGHPFYRFAAALVLLPGVVFIASLAYRFIELPINEYGKKFQKFLRNRA